MYTQNICLTQWSDTSSLCWSDQTLRRSTYLDSLPTISQSYYQFSFLNIQYSMYTQNVYVWYYSIWYYSILLN